MNADGNARPRRKLPSITLPPNRILIAVTASEMGHHVRSLSESCSCDMHAAGYGHACMVPLLEPLVIAAWKTLTLATMCH